MSEKHRARIIGIAAMLIWSVILLYFYATGQVKEFVRPEYLRVGCLLAGLGLGVVGVFNAIHLTKETDCGHDHHDHGDEDEHDHEDTSLVGNGAMFLVMVVPALLAAAFADSSYQSSKTIRNKGFVDDPRALASRVGDDFKTQEPPKTQDQPPGSSASSTSSDDEWEYTLADLEKVVDRSDEGNLLLTVDQLFFTTGDEEIQQVLQGQPVETVGQILPEIGYNPDGRRVRVFTLMVTCCRADAQPVSIPLQFEGPAPVVSDEQTAEYPEMSWIKVSGTMKYPVENGRTQALIEVKKIEPTEEPLNDIMF